MLDQKTNQKSQEDFCPVITSYSIHYTKLYELTTVYRLKAIKQEVQALDYQIQAQQNGVRAEVKSRYIDVLYALHLQDLSKKQKELADELYKAAYTKFETGMGNGIDLTKAELQVAEAENFQSEAERMLHIGRYSLFRLMGLEIADINYGIQFADTLSNKEVVVSQITALSLLREQPEYLAAVATYEASYNFV